MSRYLGKLGLTLTAIAAAYSIAAVPDNAFASEKSELLERAAESRMSVAINYETQYNQQMNSVNSLALSKPESEGEKDALNNSIMDGLIRAGSLEEKATREYLASAANLERAARESSKSEYQEKINLFYKSAEKAINKAIDSYQRTLTTCETQVEVQEFFDFKQREGKKFSSGEEERGWYSEVGNYLSKMAGLEEGMHRLSILKTEVLVKMPAASRADNRQTIAENIESLRDSAANARKNAAELYQLAAGCYLSANQLDQRASCESKAAALFETIANEK